MAPLLSMIPVEQLDFDPDNPRLPERLAHADASEVLDYFLLECNLTELMMSIAEQGYFHGEPLLVVPGLEGRYVVVEGNRRLASLKILTGLMVPRSMTKAVGRVVEEALSKPTEVPCLIFEERSSVLRYLGYRHITGIKEWDALAKARYLSQLRERYPANQHDVAHRALAKEIGSKANAVARTLTAYNLLMMAKDTGLLARANIESKDVHFSLLTTAIGYENIAHYIGLSGPGDVEIKNVKPDAIVNLFRWSFFKADGFKTKLVESRNYEKLARIVDYPAALATFEEGATIDEADVLAEGPVEAVRQSIDKASTSLTFAQNAVSRATGLTKADLEEAARVKRLAAALEGAIRSLIAVDEE
jgi:hypothetical protein